MKDIQLINGTGILEIEREWENIIPSDDTIIEEDDRVIVVLTETVGGGR